MLLVSNIQSNKLNYGAQLVMIVLITAKPTILRGRFPKPKESTVLSFSFENP